jgi:hypothetical protein
MLVKKWRLHKFIKYLLVGVGIVSAPIVIAAWVYLSWEKIPSKIHIHKGETEEFDFAILATAHISCQECAI